MPSIEESISVTGFRASSLTARMLLKRKKASSLLRRQASFHICAVVLLGLESALKLDKPSKIARACRPSMGLSLFILVITFSIIHTFPGSGRGHCIGCSTIGKKKKAPLFLQVLVRAHKDGTPGSKNLAAPCDVDSRFVPPKGPASSPPESSARLLCLLCTVRTPCCVQAKLQPTKVWSPLLSWAVPAVCCGWGSCRVRPGQLVS